MRAMPTRAVMLAAALVAGCYRDAAPEPPGASADLGAPPPDQVDAPPARPGMVWVPGKWARSGDRWVWLEGYFEKPRPGYRYEPGRWIVDASGGSAGATSNVQWASTVRAVSSEYSPDGWSAKQVLGPPNVYPASSDQAQAWASLTPDAPSEFIEVGYDRPMRAAGVDVYETFNPGAVGAVELVNAAGSLIIATSPSSDQPLRVRVKCTAEPVVAVRVTLDSAAVPGWNEIDAIGLVGCD